MYGKMFKNTAVGRCPSVVAAALKVCDRREELLPFLPEDLRAQVTGAPAPPEEAAPTSVAMQEFLDTVADSDVRKSMSCVVCFELLAQENSARQCPKSHLLCVSCLDTLAERAGGKCPRVSSSSSPTDSVLVKCPTCREAFSKHSYQRNLLAEQMAAVVEGPCALGCGARLRGKDLRLHESACPQRRVACALACGHVGLSAQMAKHMLSEVYHPRLAAGAEAPLTLALAGAKPPLWHRVELPPSGQHLFVSLCIEPKELPSLGKSILVHFRRWSEPGCPEQVIDVDVVLRGSGGHRWTTRLFHQSNTALLLLPLVSEPMTLAVVPA